MRASLFLVASLIAGPAMAGSIDLVKSQPRAGDTESVTRITCPSCTLVPKAAATAYRVPALKPGEQTVELKTVEGKEKIVRTEAWLGGSPVVFVSDATPEMVASYFPEKVAPSRDGIDEASKTAAVERAPVTLSDKAAEPVKAGLDVSGFALRSN